MKSIVLIYPSFFLVTQVLSIFESPLSFASALVLGILELIFLSLLIHILSLLGPTILLPLARILIRFEP